MKQYILLLSTLFLLQPVQAGLEFSIYNGMDKPIKHEHSMLEFSMGDIAPHSNAGRYIERTRNTDTLGHLAWNYSGPMCISTLTEVLILGKDRYQRWSASGTGSLIGKITVNGKTTNLGNFFNDPSKLVRGTWSNETISIKKDEKTGQNVPVFTPDKDGVLRTPDGQTPNSFACDTTIHFVVDKNGKVAREENGITMSLP